MIREPYRLAWLWYLLGALWLLLVAIFSLIPLPQDDVGVDDKLIHLLAYALLSGWFSLLVRSRILLVWIVAGLVLFGITIELLQSLTHYRYTEWGDVLANSLGAERCKLCGADMKDPDQDRRRPSRRYSAPRGPRKAIARPATSP